MFGSAVLDVAIGIVLVYLLLSLVASALRELVEAVVKSRAVDLERGVRALLDDPHGEGVARMLYEHPLVSSLYRDDYKPALRRFRGRNLPAYIPARNFAAALLDIAARGPVVGPYAAQQTAPALTVDHLRAAIPRLPSPFVQRALLVAIDGAFGDPARVQRNVEAWYDSAMDRVSGWYKRRTQLWLFVIGLGTTLLLHVDTLALADYLSHNDAARAALVARAEAVAHDTAYRRLVGNAGALDEAAGRAAYNNLQSFDLPIGWQRRLPPPPDTSGWALGAYLLTELTGLLLTAVAITLGAPFWFDVLNKFMIVRSTVKPHEKSPEEGSTDPPGRTNRTSRGSAGRDAGALDRGADTPRAAIAARGAVVRAHDLADTGTATNGGNGTAAVADPPVVVPPHAEVRWAEGDPDEGIL